jgi:hypothetical protein
MDVATLRSTQLKGNRRHPLPCPLAGLAESLQVQVEALHDRLHVAHLQRLPTTPPLQQQRCTDGGICSGGGDPHGRQLQQLQGQVSELFIQNSALKSAAARLSWALAEALAYTSDRAGSVGGPEGAAALLRELSAAESILQGLQV